MLHAQVGIEDRKQIYCELNAATDAKWYRRLKIVDLSSQGYSVPALAQLFDLSEATIRSYIHVYS